MLFQKSLEAVTLQDFDVAKTPGMAAWDGEALYPTWEAFKKRKERSIIALSELKSRPEQYIVLQVRDEHLRHEIGHPFKHAAMTQGYFEEIDITAQQIRFGNSPWYALTSEMRQWLKQYEIWKLRVRWAYDPIAGEWEDCCRLVLGEVPVSYDAPQTPVTFGLQVS